MTPTLRQTQPPLWLSDVASRFVTEEATSIMRHGVRNKLTAIRNAAFFLRKKTSAREQSAEKVNQFFDLIDAELDAASHLMTVHSASAAADRINVRATDVGVVLCRLMDESRGLAGVTIKNSVSGTAWVKADENELAWAVYCVLENAVEATGATNLVEVVISELSVEKAPATRSIKIEVRDRGPGLAGITVEDAVRPNCTTKEHRQGLGLGMAKRVVSRWGGEFLLNPGVEGGLVVSLKLPRAEETVVADKGEKPHILLVDDENNVRLTLVALLEDEGAFVEEASTLKEARALLEKNVFDGLVVDMNLPDGSGVDLLATLGERHSQSARIILSGNSVFADKSVADLVLMKGSTGTDLVQQVMGLVKIRLQRRLT